MTVNNEEMRKPAGILHLLVGSRDNDVVAMLVHHFKLPGRQHHGQHIGQQNHAV